MNQLIKDVRNQIIKRLLQNLLDGSIRCISAGSYNIGQCLEVPV